jgi:hypothetical protein
MSGFNCYNILFSLSVAALQAAIVFIWIQNKTGFACFFDVSAFQAVAIVKIDPAKVGCKV